MQKQAVIIFGPPGSGKGTQAELLAKKYDFIHFDTGRYLENLFRNLNLKIASKQIWHEKKLWDTGKLETPSFILGITGEATRKISKADFNIVYSGSPRTVYETIGDSRHLGLLKILSDIYKKENIKIFQIQVKELTSIKRNSNRMVCSVCGLPVLADSKSKHCAFCAGPLRKRTLDDPNVIKVRLKEYSERTLPIINEYKKVGLKINIIDGEPAPYKVFEQIEKILHLGEN